MKHFGYLQHNSNAELPLSGDSIFRNPLRKPRAGSTRGMKNYPQPQGACYAICHAVGQPSRVETNPADHALLFKPAGNGVDCGGTSTGIAMGAPGMSGR
jgi:hypothetical protein